MYVTMEVRNIIALYLMGMRTIGETVYELVGFFGIGADSCIIDEFFIGIKEEFPELHEYYYRQYVKPYILY